MKAFYLPSGLTADEVADGLIAEDSATRDSDIFILARKFLEVQAELEAIKKQKPIGYASDAVIYPPIRNQCGGKYTIPVYLKPVHQHSFTVEGHTFYADNEVDILYLERKFGVGGKAKLEVVKDE